MEKEMHAGHRERLRGRFLREGLDQFEPHNILELLLFYAIPRKDTNELAHRLLDTFGSLSAVFDAPVEALARVEGIGLNAAALIKLIPAANRRYLGDRLREGIAAGSSEASGALMLSKFNGITVEQVVLFCMDNLCRVRHSVVVSKGTQTMVSINLRKIVETALRQNASNVILGHNHPNGVAVPSKDDVDATKALRNLLAAMDIDLRDHIIVADGEYFAMSDSPNFSHLFRKREDQMASWAASTRE